MEAGDRDGGQRDSDKECCRRRRVRWWRGELAMRFCGWREKRGAALQVVDRRRSCREVEFRRLRVLIGTRRAALVERRRTEMTVTKGRVEQACRGKTGASGLCRLDRARKSLEWGAGRAARFQLRLVGATAWLAALFWSTRLPAAQIL